MVIRPMPLTGKRLSAIINLTQLIVLNQIEEDRSMNAYDFNVKAQNGEEVALSSFDGKVLLIVNTATGCGFTPQYTELQEMYEEYRDRGFEILDFPCNQFGE